MSGQTRRPGELPPLPVAVSAGPKEVKEVEIPAKARPPLAVTPAAEGTPAPIDPVIGTVIGERYRILEKIGFGGMATVYRAEHQLLHKAVAVKLLLPELVGEGDMAARFEREAIAAARLDHPNVVSITDFGRTPEGRMFLVMEYLEGTPLDQLIEASGRLPPDRAIEIGRQLLRGLAHAHDVGVVHRDLKPSNVMVSRHTGGREVAKIIDFGIAKIVGGASIGPHVQTQAGIVFGTADFLAPERLLGKGDSDPRSDLYAAGVVLYEMLTGVRPFHDPDPYVVVKRAIAEEPRPPSAIVSDVTPALDAIVLRALTKEPTGRYASARDFLEALDPLARRNSTPSGLVVPSLPAPSFPPVASDSMPRGSVSQSPLPLYQPASPRPWKNPRIVIPVLGVVVVIVLLLVARGGPAPTVPASSTSKETAGIDALVAKAADADTVADRQSAFDRLVAFGYVDRVPWVPMLGKDLAQLPSCEERKDALAKLRKVNDPKALPYIQEAAARPDNGCLADDAREALTVLRAPNPATEAPKKKPGHTTGGGGHF